MTSVGTGRSILITGAGGAAAVTLIRALRDRYRIIAADMDPLAVGLYLVPAVDRVLLPRGDDPTFVPILLQEARTRGVDLVIPTVDVELAGVSRAAADFAAHAVAVLVETPATLDRCLDKWELVQVCAPSVRVPVTVLLDDETTSDQIAALGAPFIVKPRRGSGGRGFAVIDNEEMLGDIPRDGTQILQELLPGDEFSIDVLARPDGHVVAAVPRRRDKVDSGIAVASRTMKDESLVAFGRTVAAAVGVVGVVNVQARRAADGTPALLEVNPRFPGTMALTMIAGVDMPNLAVAAAFGEPIPDSIDFSEVAVVRHWDEVVVPIEEYAASHAAAYAADDAAELVSSCPTPVAT